MVEPLLPRDALLARVATCGLSCAIWGNRAARFWRRVWSARSVMSRPARHQASAGLAARGAGAAAVIVLVAPQALRGAVVWRLPRSEAPAGSRADAGATAPERASPRRRGAPRGRGGRDTAATGRRSMAHGLRTPLEAAYCFQGLRGRMPTMPRPHAPQLPRGRRNIVLQLAGTSCARLRHAVAVAVGLCQPVRRCSALGLRSQSRRALGESSAPS